MTNSGVPAKNLKNVGEIVIRYGLALVIFWIGCLKFAAYEAQGVQAYASNSPLLSWAYGFLDVRNFSRALGMVEILLAMLILMRPFSARASMAGSLGAVAMFLTTLSFLVTTPGVWQPGYGFPSLSGAPGQFLLKDLVLLGAAIWSAGEAWLACSDTSAAAFREAGELKTANVRTGPLVR